MEPNELLKYIFHEDLYIIKEPKFNQKINEGIEVEYDQSNATVVEEPTTTPISYFGNNEKGILILIYDAANELLKQSDLDLLMNILEKGLGFSKNDFALVNTANCLPKQVLNEIRYNYLISFGADISEFFEIASHYTIQQSDEKFILTAEDLSVLNNDVSKKRKLWSALKSMFNI